MKEQEGGEQKMGHFSKSYRERKSESDRQLAQMYTEKKKKSEGAVVGKHAFQGVYEKRGGTN